MSQNGLRFTLDVDGLTPTATAVVNFPSSGINSSTGASWNQNESLKTPDEAPNDSIKSGHGSENMNVKLESCRGKGLSGQERILCEINILVTSLRNSEKLHLIALFQRKV